MPDLYPEEPSAGILPIGELGDVISMNNVVRITYTDVVGKHTVREIEPYEILENKLTHKRYVLCRDELSHDWRTFLLDRIGGIELTNKTFERMSYPTNWAL